MKTLKIEEYDVVYISYDEPNAEQNWADLLTKIPWAQRVHGVYGSDSAHKAAARLATTERFITIDGDNVIFGDFLNQSINVDRTVDLDRTVLSWPSKNIINGLMYGNGGIKCWPTQFVLDMKTHENASPNNIKAQIDFCWDIKYLPIEDCFSEIHNNGSPLQAWRAGFREGVKMGLNNGVKVDSFSTLLPINFNRLLIWMTVGSDVKNGIWSILGARQGFYLTNFSNWDYVNVRDFKYLNQYWQDNVSHYTEEQAVAEADRLSNLMSSRVEIPQTFSSDQSKFFKRFDVNPARRSRLVNPSYINHDIVMITYNEPNAEENWQALKKRFPQAKRVDKIKGIHNAHKAAADLVETDMFWVVDGDAEIVSTFNFTYKTKHSDEDRVHVWRSINPVNGLEYGYGGVKLLPKNLTSAVDVNSPDMTTSISDKFKIFDEVSNITKFNTDPFNTWKSAFRECVKLSSKIIKRQNDEETNMRLDVWCSAGGDKPFGEYAIKGALAGKQFGLANKDNSEMLAKINDFDWLEEMFRTSCS